jgi:hypothetical protein
MEQSLRARLTAIFIILAVGPVLLMGLILSWRTFNVQETQALAARQLAAQRVAVEVESFINAREGELRLLSDVRGLQRLEREEQTSLLAGLLAYQDVYEALVLLDSGGNEQIYLTRLTVSREDLQSRGESAEFEQATATGDTYFSPIRFNEKL